MNAYWLERAHRHYEHVIEEFPGLTEAMREHLMQEIGWAGVMLAVDYAAAMETRREEVSA